MIHKLDPHFPISPQEPQLGHQTVSTKLERHASPFLTSSHYDLVELLDQNPSQSGSAKAKYHTLIFIAPRLPIWLHNHHIWDPSPAFPWRGSKGKVLAQVLSPVCFPFSCSLPKWMEHKERCSSTLHNWMGSHGGAKSCPHVLSQLQLCWLSFCHQMLICTPCQERRLLSCTMP